MYTFLKLFVKIAIFYAILYAILYAISYAVQHIAVQCSAAQRSAAQCGAAQRNILRNTTRNIHFHIHASTYTCLHASSQQDRSRQGCSRPGLGRVPDPGDRVQGAQGFGRVCRCWVPLNKACTSRVSRKQNCPRLGRLVLDCGKCLVRLCP